MLSKYKMLDIHVKTLDHKIYNLIADISDHVEVLKIKIQDQGGPELGTYRLIYRGTLLNDDQCLEEFGIPESSHDPIVIHLTPLPETIAKVAFKVNNEIVFTYEWDYMKDKIQVIHLKRELLMALKLSPVTMRKLELFTENGTKLQNSEDLTDIMKKEQKTEFIFDATL